VNYRSVSGVGALGINGGNNLAEVLVEGCLFDNCKGEINPWAMEFIE
jgi:hypothetical protein